MYQNVIMIAICIICVIGVLLYIFFSKPKTSKQELDNFEIFLYPDVTWEGKDPIEVYEELTKIKNRPKFTGNHKIH